MSIVARTAALYRSGSENDVVGRQVSGFFSVHEPTGTAETDTRASGDIKKKGFTSVLQVTTVQ